MSTSTESPSANARPTRPKHLRGELIMLHIALVGSMLGFAFVATKLPPPVHLVVLATLTVVLGCKASLFFYCVKPEDEVADGVDNEELGPTIKEDEAWRFPVAGSCVLFGLFVVYKYLDQEYVKLLFSCYVVFACMTALGVNISALVNLLRNKTMKPVISIEYFGLELTFVDIAGYILAGYLGYYFILTKSDYEANWIVNNIFGVSFCLLGMKHVNISTYKTGAIMLIGLFFYDVFWVFLSKPLIGSNVMVTVAKGVKAPIKLMFPQIRKSMIWKQDGQVLEHRTALSLDAPGVSTDFPSHESVLACRQTCVASPECNFLTFDNSTEPMVCQLFSDASGELVEASGKLIQWFAKEDAFMPSMLGLGDIVVPGITLALLAKWDAHRIATKGNPSEDAYIYFNWSIVAYVLSLGVTLAAMLIFEAAQPALLYIVPFVLCASFGVAITKGELNELWSFEVPDDDDEGGGRKAPKKLMPMTKPRRTEKLLLCSLV